MKNLLLLIVVVAVVAGGGYWWMQSQNSSEMSGNTDTTSGTMNGNESSPATGNETGGMGVNVEVGGSVSASMSATITYNGKSFSPSEVTIKKGGTVKWVNASGGQMWVASAQHPSHTVYDGTSRQEHCPDPSGAAFDQCAGGGDYSFTFTKTGTWNYHDHLNAQMFGKVIVVE